MRNVFIVDITPPEWPNEPSWCSFSATPKISHEYKLEINGENKYPFEILKKDTFKIDTIKTNNIVRIKCFEKWTIKFAIPDSLKEKNLNIRIERIRTVQCYTSGKQSIRTFSSSKFGAYNDNRIISIHLKSNPQKVNYFLVPYGEWILSGSDFWINNIKEYSKVMHDIKEVAKIENFFNKKGVLFGTTAEKITTNKIINYKVIGEYNGYIQLGSLNLMLQRNDKELFLDLLSKK